jgi:hypothetical protein
LLPFHEHQSLVNVKNEGPTRAKKLNEKGRLMIPESSSIRSGRQMEENIKPRKKTGVQILRKKTLTTSLAWPPASNT